MAKKKINKYVKSKERVADFGEVYTQEREVDAMLDLVKTEVNKIESKFIDIIMQKLIQFNYPKMLCA